MINCDTFGAYLEGLLIKIPDNLKEDQMNKIKKYVREKNYTLKTKDDKHFIITLSEEEIDHMKEMIKKIHQNFKDKIIASTFWKDSKENIGKINKTVGISKTGHQDEESITDRRQILENAGYQITKSALTGRGWVGCYLSGIPVKELEEYIKDNNMDKYLVVRGSDSKDSEYEKLGICKPLHIIFKHRDKATILKDMTDLLALIGKKPACIRHFGDDKNADETPIRENEEHFDIPVRVTMTQKGGHEFIREALKEQTELYKTQNNLQKS